jgi:hypothetical protein
VSGDTSGFHVRKIFWRACSTQLGAHSALKADSAMSAAAPPAQRLAVSSGGALDDVAVLDLVLRFAGSHQALYVKVNKAWAACYESISSDGDTAVSSRDHVHSASCTSFDAAFGSAARLRLALKFGLQLETLSVHTAAGKAADVSTLTAAHELGMPWAPEMLLSMAKHNRLPELQWLHTEQGCQLPADISAHAAEGGSIDMLNWLKGQGCVFDEDTMRSAAEHGHVVRYLRGESCPWDNEVCLAALRRGDRELVLWALDHGFDVESGEFLSNCWHAVINTSSLEMVMWFEQLQLCDPDSLDLKHAIYSGQVEMCRYFHAQGCGWDSHIESCAATSGKPEMCEWLLEVNYTIDMQLLAERAALFGKLTVLQWALQHGAALHVGLLGAAAEGGHMTLLQYLVSQGCDWAEVLGICLHAASGGHIYVLEYVCDKIEQDEERAWLSVMLNAAGGHGKLAAAKWLRQRGAEWPGVLRFSFHHDDGEGTVFEWTHDLLEWARAEGCTSPTTTATA